MTATGARTETFPELLALAMRSDPGRPLVTSYDDRSGARTELSVTTYANWVAKTANLLTDEYLLDDADTLAIELPAHWLATVFLGAAWSAGISVTTDPAVPAHLVVRGPQPLADQHWADVPVLACSLTPFATRFDDPPAEGVDDFGLLWPGQPDVFQPAVAPNAATVAWRRPGAGLTQADLIGRAASVAWSGDRLITDAAPTTDCATTTFLAALVRSGSVVLVDHPDEHAWAGHRETERATDELRALPG